MLEDLRAQLKASMVSHETMQSQSAALAELQHQMHTMAKLQQELMTQAQVIGSLKTQIGASAEQHRQLICQVCSRPVFNTTYTFVASRFGLYCIICIYAIPQPIFHYVTRCFNMTIYLYVYSVDIRRNAKDAL